MSCSHLKVTILLPAEDADDSEKVKCNSCGEEFVRTPILSDNQNLTTGSGRKYGSIGLPKRNRFRNRRSI